MSWTKGYLQAKLDNVEFFIRRANKKNGRRIVAHTYPRRDNVEHEDMGSTDKDFTLDAYVLGDDYFTKRNALEKVLDAGGVHTLVHPYRSVIPVVVNDWTAVESTDEGGMARYSLSFSLEGEEELTRAIPNPEQQALNAKASVVAAIIAWFADVYDLTNKPFTSVDDCRSTIDSCLSVMDAAKRTAGTVATFKRALGNAQGDIIALSLNAQLLGQTFSDLVNFGTEPGDAVTFGATDSDAQDQIREQRQMGGSTEQPLVNTPLDIAQDPDYPAFQVQQLLGLSNIAANIGLIALVPFETVSDAEQAQAQLFTTIDQVLQDPFVPDTIYESLREAKRAVFDSLQSRVITLPLLVDFVSPNLTNSIALNYSLYGNLDNEQDFIERNELIHPGFVPAAVPLQVKVINE